MSPRTKRRIRKRRVRSSKSTSTKFLFVVGGVISGLGKGIAVASIARILKGKGFRVTAMKIDPYVNVDAGTMNPTEHGEVFVTKDGLETDQDIGNYERFLDMSLSQLNYMTTGSVYLSLIRRERNLEFGGKVVEVVPDVPNEVIRRIELMAAKERAEIALIEIGGTVGEYQNILFLEAARILQLKRPGHVQFVLVSYFPIPGNLGEMKTKPTQYAVRTMNASGIQPNFILGRSSRPLDEARRWRLSMNTGVPSEDVISAPDVASVYEVPLNFEREQLGNKILKNFGLAPRQRDLRDWSRFVRSIGKTKGAVTIGIAGKYFGSGDFTLLDSYISVIEAVKHAAWASGVRPDIQWINTEEFERDPAALKRLDALDGLIVPGGFGSRGVEGKIAAIRHARTNKLPFFGLCYGMQLAVVEYARSVVRLSDANTTEVAPKTTHPVIHILPEQQEKLRLRDYGGSMRLGEFPCTLAPNSVAGKAYGARTVRERHRHRYELNNAYREKLEKAGMRISGVFQKRKLAEIVELPGHPFFVGVQFHPEFLSRPLVPHPLFLAFIGTAKKRAAGRSGGSAKPVR